MGDWITNTTMGTQKQTRDRNISNNIPMCNVHSSMDNGICVHRLRCDRHTQMVWGNP